jgi:glycosyltransferase involved in cell wall biosynthesis
MTALDRPAVTVLMSVYNGEEFLAEALASVFSQTFTDFELLVIDDGSSDRSAQILAQAGDPRLKVLTNLQNIGLTASLNRGLLQARGMYIARLDADDLALAGRLARQKTILDRQPGLGLVGSFAGKIDASGQPSGQWVTPLEPEDIYYLLNFRNCLTHSTVMYRRELVLGLGGYRQDRHYAQDYDLWFRLSKKTRLALIPEMLVLWRQGRQGISATHKQEQDRLVLEIVRPNLENLAGQGLTDYELQSLQFNQVIGTARPERLCRLLDTINHHLLLDEKNLIKTLGLRPRLIKKRMASKKKLFLDR